MNDSKEVKSMQALPVRYLDKATGKRVQAYSVDFPLCYKGGFIHKRIECAFYDASGFRSCACTQVKQAFNVENVIFLEIKE